MLGMHGTYEANNAMHDCDLMIAIGARFDDRITGRINAFSPGSRKIQVDIDASSINKNIHVDIPIVGDVAHVLEAMLAEWKRIKAQARQGRGQGVVGRDRQMAGAQLPRLPAERRHHHAAIRHPAALRGDQGQRHLHHHRGRPAPDVGGAVLQVRGAATAG